MLLEVLLATPGLVVTVERFLHLVTPLGEGLVLADVANGHTSESLCLGSS